MSDFRLQNFLDLEPAWIEAIRQWRNHDSIRAWMTNSNLITKTEHQKFLKNLSSSKNQKYWLVFQDQVAIGVVYLILEPASIGTIGMYLFPDHLGKGLGSWILDHYLDYLKINFKLTKIKLAVKSNNQAAIHLYKKFGFQTVYTEAESASQPLITMEKSP